MPTVSDAFAEFLKRIELNPTWVGLASQRYNAVKDVIEANLSGATVRQIGSFQRKTKIRPLDLSDHLDVDALAVYGEARSYATDGKGKTPNSVLTDVLKALRKSDVYRVMDPASDSPVVVLEYADGFKMEVAAGYRDLSGRYPRNDGPACYIVGDSVDKNWVPADYDFDAQFLSQLNQEIAAREMLVPTIKILKRLVRTAQVPLKSFHVEILAGLVLPPAFRDWRAQSKTWDFSHAVAYFLSNAAAHLKGPIAFPGSFSPPVDSGLPVDELKRIGIFLGELGADAWKLCKIEDAEAAITRWGKFFGEPFPPVSYFK